MSDPHQDRDRSGATEEGPPPSPPRPGVFAGGPVAFTGEEIADAIYLAAWRQTRGGDEAAQAVAGAGEPEQSTAEPPSGDRTQHPADRGKQPPELKQRPEPEQRPEPDSAHAGNVDFGRAEATRPRPAPAPDPGSGQSDGGLAAVLTGGVFPALRDRQRLARALRPFHLRLRTSHQQEFDVEATARDYARELLAAWTGTGQEENRPTPVLAPKLIPERERGTHLTVLIDESVSMLFQQQVVRDFTDLLRRSGVFRSTRFLRFESDAQTPSRVMVREAGSTKAVDLTSLPESERGPHVVMVLSDGIGEGWHTGVFQGWLGGLGRRFPVGIVHLLDSHQWRKTGIRPQLMELTAAPGPTRAPASQTYRASSFQWPGEPFAADQEDAAEDEVVLPVLELRAEPLRQWAGFVMHEPPGRALKVSALKAVPGSADDGAAAPEADAHGALEDEDPVIAVRRFYQDSPSAAFRLAVALAAVPLTGPVIDIVCERVLGKPQASELAEIFFSGLVYAIDDGDEDDDVHPARCVCWDYRAGIREALLSLGSRRSRTRAVLASVAQAFGDADPWFETLGRIVEGMEIRELELDAVSLRLANDSLPALESIGVSDRYRGLFRDVRNRPLWGGRSVSQRHGLETDRERNELGSSKFPQDFSEARPATAAVYPTKGVGAPNSSDNLPVSTGESSMTSSTDSSTPTFPSLGEGRRRGHGDGGSSATAWGRIPPRNPIFTGRADLLAQLRDQLLSGAGQASLSALNGMAGVGKTQLATEYVYRYSGEYDLIWWISAERANQIHEAFALLAEQLGLAQTGTPIPNMVHAVREALRRGDQYRSWLIVFDNAQGPEDIDRYLPVGGAGHVIVTSRNALWTVRGRNAFLPVDVFTREESIDLLRKCGPEDISDVESDQIAEVLGDLPSALRQAAAWMYETATPAAEYIAEFQEKQAELLATLSPVDPDYPVTVVTATNLSLDKLATTNPAALELLQTCSFFATEPIPRYLFRFARGVQAPPALDRALSSSTELGRAFRDIGRFGLAQINHRTSTIQLHRLVQDALQISLSEEEKESIRHCAHMLLSKSDPQNTSPESRNRYAELLPHVWASEAWDCVDPWVRDLVIQQVYVTELRGEYAESRDLGETAHKLWTAKLGEDDPHTLLVQLRLVRALRRLGELRQAYELCERTVAALTALHGPDAEETLEASTEFVRDLRFAGDFRASMELALSIYEKSRRMLGTDDPETLTAAHDYAYALLLNGDYPGSAELFSEVYRLKELVFGANAPVTLAAADGYTDALMESGDYRKALKIQQENTDRIRHVLGDDQSGTLSNMDSLSAMLRRNGRQAEAVELSEFVWRKANDRFGADSSTALYATSNYATALRGADRYDEALRLAEEACAGYVAFLGADHPHTAAANVNRAVTLRILGRVVEARELDEWSLEVFTQKLGADHASTIACSINLASDLAALGDVSGALERDTDNLERCRRVLSDRHPLTILAQRNLALDRRMRGEDVDAELDEVERLYSEIMGPEHSATLSMRQQVRGNADVYLSQL